MESKKKLSKLPSTAKVVGGFALVVGIVAIAFYIFQRRVVNENNTLSDGKPGNIGENINKKTSNVDKEEVVEWYEASIATLERRAGEMKKKAIDAGEDMQDVYQTSLDKTEAEIEALRMELKQVREATADNWDALKAKIDETRARVEEQLKNDSIDYPS